MKNSNTKLGLLVAALLSVGQTSKANRSISGNEQFTPIERLAPQDRAVLMQQIEILRKTVKIDWDSVVIGINQDGELVLKGKDAAKVTPVSNPTCWTY